MYRQFWRVSIILSSIFSLTLADSASDSNKNDELEIVDIGTSTIRAKTTPPPIKVAKA